MKFERIEGKPEKIPLRNNKQLVPYDMMCPNYTCYKWETLPSPTSFYMSS